MKPEPSPNACSKVKEGLLINLHERDDLAPYERMLFDTWGNQIQTAMPVTADV